MIEQVFPPLVRDMGLVAFAFSRLNSGLLQHFGQWEESHAPPARNPPIKEIVCDSSYGSINSPSRGRSRDIQLI